jgi:hypothetical protein
MTGWRPWRIALVDMVQPVRSINIGVLDICKESFLKDILSRLPEEQLQTMGVYDDFTAVNGAAGVAYVDSMRRDTSAGNPWKKKKKFFIHAVPARGDLLDPVMPDEEIMERVAHIEQSYQNGERYHPVFCAHLKDEAVSKKKAITGKTRVFTGAPFDWSIVVRKYTLSFIRLMQNNRFAFEAAPGTVAQSREWGGLFDYLTFHGRDRMVAGDYRAFDKTMPPEMIRAAFWIISECARASGNFDEEDLRVIECIAYDTAFPLVDYNGDLMEFCGSNPSGHPLTVIINCLANSLYMRYAYYTVNPKREVRSFKKNVSLMTYGDDNVMGVSKAISWFHHTSISSSLGELGIDYTMPDKDSESIPFVDISEVDFLKRRWVWDDDYAAWVAPLDLKSIEKSLMVWVQSPTITEEEQCVAILSSAHREYSFHGRAQFEKFCRIRSEIIEALDLDYYVTSSTFPSRTYLIEQFQTA